MRNEKLGCALKATEFFTLRSSLSIVLHSSLSIVLYSSLSIALRSSLTLVLHSSLSIVLHFQYFFQMFLSDRTTGDELSILWQLTIQLDEVVDSGR